MAEAIEIRRRAVPAHQLPATIHPVLARVLAARGVTSSSELRLGIPDLLPPDALMGLPSAVDEVVKAITNRKRIVIAGDYDCDGATGVALAVLGLRALGAASVDYVVPDRVSMGYGLSPGLVDLAINEGAELLVTVDNGISSIRGVDHACEQGLRVVITDHHLAGRQLPAAHAILNPNQGHCEFPSKHLAGVGVMFYLLVAVRARLRDAGFFGEGQGPNLGEYLDLVALGTVADLVRLDANNRILVNAGLALIRSGRARPGLLALMHLAGRDRLHVDAGDLGFALGPRINAAGRLDNIRTGIECLLCNDEPGALALATELDGINRQRRQLQAEMNASALSQWPEVAADCFSVCAFDPEWHEGIVGLVASRLKEHCNRPSIAFARAQAAGELKGSARSIEGLHLRDLLAEIDAENPGLILRFGGHAMAAGLSLMESRIGEFEQAFEGRCRARLRPEQVQRVIETDGVLDSEQLDLELARSIAETGPWGQGMPEPVFEGLFEVMSARAIGADQTHVRYQLRDACGVIHTGIDFGGIDRMQTSGPIELCYKLSINRWRGRESVDLLVQHLSSSLS